MRASQEAGDKETTELMRSISVGLMRFSDDEEGMRAAVRNFQTREMKELTVELVVGYRNSENHQAHVAGVFADLRQKKPDFENPSFPIAYRMFEFSAEYVKHVESPFNSIFDKRPESFLPFSRHQLFNALDVCATKDTDNIDAYSTFKNIIDEGKYVDSEEAIMELIENFSDRKTRASMIFHMKA